MTTLRRLERGRLWLRRHSNWLLVIMAVGIAFAIVESYSASKGQSARATKAADKAVQSERRGRENAIHAIAVVAHSTLYESCVRSRRRDLAVRENALNGRTRDQAFAAFLDLYATRARVTLHDATATPAVKAAAEVGIVAIHDLEQRLDLHPKIPPVPLPCTDHRVVPSIAQFEARAATAITPEPSSK